MAKVIDSTYTPVSLQEVLLGKKILSDTWKKVVHGHHGLFQRFGQITPLYGGPVSWLRDSTLYGSDPTSGEALDLNAHRSQSKAHRAVGSDGTLVVLWAQAHGSACDLKVELVRHEIFDGVLVAPATVATLNPVMPAGSPDWAEDVVSFLLADSLTPSGKPHQYGALVSGKSVDGVNTATLNGAYLREYWIPVGDLPI